MANADTIDEFKKSYNEGFFGLKLGGIIYPARIATNREVGRDVLPLQYFINAEGTNKSHDIRWTTDKEQLVRGYPDLGCIKVGPTVGYLRVRPLRQYKKGYVPSNTELTVPNQTQIRKHFPKFLASTASKEVVWQLYNHEYWHPLEAVRMMDNGDGVGYPLSKNFGLYCHSDLPNLIIFSKNKDVGVYKDGKFELFRPHAMLKEQFTRETKVECGVCS